MPVLPIAILTFAIALAVSMGTTPIVIRVSWGMLALDRPDTRKFHPAPIPRLGGVAVLAGFASGICSALWMAGYPGSLFGAVQYHWIGWLGAIVALFACGVVDDLYGLGPLTKLVVQIMAGVGVYAAGFRIDFVRVPGGGEINLGLLALPVTLLWIVGVTNALNLIDGLDGLATGLGLLICSTIVAISYYRGVFPVTILSLALAGSLLGFLPYNFSPARIFLGDSGSQFIGFTLAVASIRGLQKSATAVAIFAPILVLGLPILDTCLVVLRRTWRIHGAGSPRVGWRERLSRSRGLFQADREHIHHNLLDLGLSHRKAVLVLYLVASVFCLAAFALVALRDPSLALVLAGAVAVATAVVKLWAVRRRVTPPCPAAARVMGDPSDPAAPGLGAVGEPPASEPVRGAGRC